MEQQNEQRKQLAIIAVKAWADEGVEVPQGVKYNLNKDRQVLYSYTLSIYRHPS